MNEEPAYAPEIYGAKKIGQVEIENETPSLVDLGIGDDGAALMEAVGREPETLVLQLSLAHAGIK